MTETLFPSIQVTVGHAEDLKLNVILRASQCTSIINNKGLDEQIKKLC